MANRKLARRIYKLIRRVASEEDRLVFTIDGVQAAIEDGSRGIVVLAGETGENERNLSYQYIFFVH